MLQWRTMHGHNAVIRDTSVRIRDHSSAQGYNRILWITIFIVIKAGYNERQICEKIYTDYLVNKE